jgi:ribosomal protein S8
MIETIKLNQQIISVIRTYGYMTEIDYEEIANQFDVDVELVKQLSKLIK